MSRRARLVAVLLGLVLALVLGASAAARAADFGYLGVLGCIDTPPEDPRSLNWVSSVAVSQGGSPVYVGASSPLGSAAPHRVIAYDPSGRQLWSIDHAASGVFGDPYLGVSSDGIYVADNYKGFHIGRITRFVAGAAGAREAASWEVTGQVISVVGSKTETSEGALEFVAVLTRSPAGGIYFFDKDGKSLGGVGIAENDRSFSLGVPTGVSSGGGRLIVADNASTDGINITTGRLASYSVVYRDGGLQVGTVHHVDVPFYTGGIWGASDGIWLMGLDDRGSFARYTHALQPIASFSRSSSTPGRTTQVPFSGIAADGHGNVYLADGDRVLRLGPGGALPPSGTPIGQCGGGAPTRRLTLDTPPQNVFRKHGVVVTVTCALPCTSVARGAITIRGRHRRKLRFKSDRETVAHTTTRLHPRLSRGQLRRLRASLVAGLRATLKVTVTATDTAGVVTRRTIRGSYG